MDKNRICRICNKRFASGKAMGGHMRSHLAKHPGPSIQRPQLVNDHHQSPITNLPSPSPSSSHDSASLMQDPSPSVKPKLYFKSPSKLSAANTKTKRADSTSKNNNSTRKRLHSSLNSRDNQPVNPEFTTPTKSSLAAMEFEETDQISPERNSPNNNSSGKRSQRKRRSVSSDSSDAEGAAYGLLKMKNDPNFKGIVPHPHLDYMENDIEVDTETESEDKDEGVHRTATKVRVRAKYWCQLCKKGFRTHQGLGGHVANHRKPKTCIKDEGFVERIDGAESGLRTFQCPFCDKAFASGQALGGHKKVHFTYLTVDDKSTESLLDLNLPPPEEDIGVYDAEVSMEERYHSSAIDEGMEEN